MPVGMLLSDKYALDLARSARHRCSLSSTRGFPATSARIERDSHGLSGEPHIFYGQWGLRRSPTKTKDVGTLSWGQPAAICGKSPWHFSSHLQHFSQRKLRHLQSRTHAADQRHRRSGQEPGSFDLQTPFASKFHSFSLNYIGTRRHAAECNYVRDKNALV